MTFKDLTDDQILQVSKAVAASIFHRQKPFLIFTDEEPEETTEACFSQDGMRRRIHFELQEFTGREPVPPEISKQTMLFAELLDALKVAQRTLCLRDCPKAIPNTANVGLHAHQPACLHFQEVIKVAEESL